jgi:galactokinase/mevalonate kinase-like predicted kinase
MNSSPRVLLSLPPAMAAAFETVEPRRAFPDWFASCDPPGTKLGSAGGTIQLLFDCWKREGSPGGFADWVTSGRKKLVVLAGGQSRRLPAYAPQGKIFIPLPAFRWSLGQAIDGTLLDFIVPDFLRVLESGEYPLAVCSGDVALHIPPELPPLPEADILCLGMWVPPETATSFGVFFTRRENPQELAFFRQKPPPADIRRLARDFLCMVDTGIWLLGPRAVHFLLARCGWKDSAGFPGDGLSGFDLYSGLGPTLGTDADPRMSPGLTTAVVAMDGATFHHLGTSRQLIESVTAIQNTSLDQLAASPIDLKPHPDLYVLNSDFPFSKRHAGNRLVWVENCTLPADQPLGERQIITGIPNLHIDLPDGICLDIVPVDSDAWCVRPYGFDDRFDGPFSSALWMGIPAPEWLERRGISPADAAIDSETDIQRTPLFPVVGGDDLTEDFVRWMCATDPEDSANFRGCYLARRLSAMQICEQAHIPRLYAIRRQRIAQALPRMRANAAANPFYRLDLSSVARYYPKDQVACASSPRDPISAIHDAMLESAMAADPASAQSHEARAFGLLREAVIDRIRPLLRSPVKQCLADQIVWGRSPIRLDLAGGWTDTPPYCFKKGGCVLNVAADINGQPPVQVFLRVSKEPHIVLRSIDLGVELRIETHEELQAYAEPGSGFALARAALCLAGFHPAFRPEGGPQTLRDHLSDFGGGIEISLLAAVPKGSGLGTSSIIAATLLGTLSEACGLGWDRPAIVRLTLAVEQMLTTCGGWQDQVGALYRGIKLAETPPGLDQNVALRWVPEHLLADPSHLAAVRLYYTGISRMASGILHEIVRGMFLNEKYRLDLLDQIGVNARHTFDAFQRGNWSAIAACIAKSWTLNCRLDPGTNPPAVREIFSMAEDFTAGGKLLGAGGGGYALFLAKDEDAARRLQSTLEANPPNPRARFVALSVSDLGLHVTKS